jgi:hypothetical protein
LWAHRPHRRESDPGMVRYSALTRTSRFGLNGVPQRPARFLQLAG